jgi:hypothetical protein
MLLIAARHRARLRREVVVTGELEQPWVEADVFPEPLEDDAFQVVVERGSRNTPKGDERLDVAAEETRQRLIQGEAGVDGAWPGEHQHEARQDAPRASARRRGYCSRVAMMNAL